MMVTSYVSEYGASAASFIDLFVASRVVNSQDTTSQLDAIAGKYGSNPAQNKKLPTETPELSKTEANHSSSFAPESKTTLAPQALPSSQKHENNPKKVTFAAKPEVSTFASLPPHVEEPSEAVINGAGKRQGPIYHPTERMLELDDNDQVVGSSPLELVVPLREDDPAFQTSTMGSLGPIVAEMNVMGPVQDDTDMEDEDDDTDDDDDESLDEDDLGMTNIGRLITTDYRAEMEALMKKHEAALKGVGAPREESMVSSSVSSSSRAVTLNEHALEKLDANPEAADGSEGPSYAEEKELKEFNHRTRRGVRFADNVDVSPAPSPIPTPKDNMLTSQGKKPAKAPFSEDVIERTTKSVEPVVKPSSSKPSRFKAGLKSAKSGGPVLPVINSAEPASAERDSIPPVIATTESPKKVSRFKAVRQGGT
jgi:unconventional prefoldin RPB5 interactor 1